MGPMTRFLPISLFDIYFPSSRCSHIPHERGDPAQSQSQSHGMKFLNVTIGRAACEACSATWNLGTNSAFALGPRKTMENLDRDGRSHDLPDANWLLTSSPALNLRDITLIPICAVLFFFCFYTDCKPSNK
jgi:hypothetical protein